MHPLRTWAWLVPLAAVVPSLLWASPFGPAQDMTSRLQLFFYGYPAWLILSIIWLVPGLLVAKALNWRLWYTLPVVAGLVQLTIAGFGHWPPSRWWPTYADGQPARPLGHFMGFIDQSWHGYLFSLWPRTFMALVTALSLLIAQSLVRPNTSLERTRER